MPDLEQWGASVANYDHVVTKAPSATISSPPVLVLADNPNVFHHGSVGVIRSLGRLGVPVYAVTTDRFTPVAASRYLRGAFVHKPRGLDAVGLLEDVKKIGHLLSRPAVII